MEDITLNTGKLVVCNDAGVTKEIDDSKLLSARSVSRAANNDLGWHPMLKDTTVFAPKAEVIQVGLLNGDSGNYYTVWDDKNGNSSEEYATYFDTLPGDQLFEQYAYKCATAGDFDGDGIDEAVIFYLKDDVDTLKYRCYEERAFSALNNVPSVAGDMSMTRTYWSKGIYNFCDSGDLDGDGKDEIVLVTMLNDTTNCIHVYSYSQKSITLKTKIDITGEKSYGPYITVGNIGNDNDSIVYCFSKQLAIIDYDGSTLTQGSLTACSYNRYGSFEYKLVIADWDKDGVGEIFMIPLLTRETAGGDIDEGIVHYINKDKVELGSIEITNSGLGVTHSHAWQCKPVAWDIEGTGYDNYIYYGMYVYANGKTIQILENSAGADQVAIGDVDGDAKKEIITSEDGFTVTARRLLSDGSGFEELHKYLKYDYDVGKVVVLAGNFDHDSPIVEYVGHELRYTQPIPIYAIAAVPYYSELVGQYNYSPDNWGSSVTKSTSTTDGYSNSLGLSTTVSFGFKTKAFFADSESKVGVSASFNHEWSSSMTISQDISFDTGGAGDNFVVFTAIPYDIFSYKVLEVDSDAPEDGAKVGDILTIDIPRTNATYMVPVDYYNENNGACADITVFEHTIGDPSTYPTQTQAEELIAKYDVITITSFSTKDKSNWSTYDVNCETVELTDKTPSNLAFFSDKQTLAKYNPYTEVGTCPTTSVSYTTEKSSGKVISAGAGASCEQEVATGVGFANATASVEVELEYEHTWTSDISHGLTFSGTVGNLPTNWTETHSNSVYAQGLFGFPAYNLVTYDDGETFQQETFWVLDYYVEY